MVLRPSKWSLFLLIFAIKTQIVINIRPNFETPLIITHGNETENQRFCGKNGRLLKSPDNLPISCLKKDDCLGTAQCEPTTRFCCIQSIDQKQSNLLGCPKGFRPLKASGNRPLVCQPNQQSSQCPGDSVCVEDRRSKEGNWHCCGRDLADGCLPGMRALKLPNGSTRLCLPEAIIGPNLCPADSSCQWSFLIDKYQCCEEDNGCPRGELAIKTASGEVKICAQDKDCPTQSHCNFNFWTSSSQCCRRDSKRVCPINQVVYLVSQSKEPLECNNRGLCPASYECYQGHCCTSIIKCPRSNLYPTKGGNDNLQSCLLSSPDCPIDSKCEKSIVDPSQGICCSKTVLSCRNSGIPFPNGEHPQICDLKNPKVCPVDSECQKSNIPGISICCRVNKNCSNDVSTSKQMFCRPPLNSRQFPVSKQVIQRQVEYTCPFRFIGPEIEYNRERRCNSYGEWGQCSIGFTCVPSVEDSQVLLCCGPAEANDTPLYRCANLGSTPETTLQGNNVFCDPINQQNQCGRGATCQAALNSFGMMICCNSAPSATPICPEDRIPQQADAGYVPCDTGTVRQCLPTYLCLPSANLPQIALCCSRLASQPLICPNQQVIYRENGRPKICSLNQVNPCPSGYICRSSVSSPTIAICCSIPTTTTCPSGYTPQLDYSGNPIYCSQTNSNICPGGSQCLESANQINQRVCCRSTTPPRVCPEGMDALLRPDTNQLERCNNPGVPCSQPSYTCQYSEILTSYVCCGRPPQIARCADGRETYVQDFGRTYTCQPAFLNQCPNGYDCAPSSLNGISVCCRTDIFTTTLPPFTTTEPFKEATDFPTFRPPVQELTCPVGWSAYEDNTGAHHFCRSALDSSCPQGFSCVQSSVNGVFLCCRLASNLRCQNGQSAPLLQNTAPRLCAARYVNSCPQGYTCQQSTVAQVHICCSLVTNTIGSFTLGPTINGQSPWTLNGNGPIINGQSPWTLNGNGPTINGQTNPFNTINGPTINGQTNPFNTINGPTINGQRNPFAGGWSNPTISSTSSLLCNDGEIPAYVKGNLLQCNYLGQADICPPTYLCSLSNRQGINVCCHFLLKSRSPLHQYSGKQLSQNVCGKTAIVYMDNRLEPLECSKNPDICPKDFECQPSMEDSLMYCCQEAKCSIHNSDSIKKQCQDDNDCREEADERCEHSVNIPFIRLCCPSQKPILPALPPASIQKITTTTLVPQTHQIRTTPSTKLLPSLLAGEEKSRCVGRKTFLVSGNAISCLNDDTCPDDFVCSSLTTNGDPICCQQANLIERVCPENRDPYRHVSSDELAICDPFDAGDPCPASFLCKWSVVKHRHVCCTPIAFCERGRVPLIDPQSQQAKRCYEKSSATTGMSEQCAQGYACVESTVPRVRVCCSVVGAAFVVGTKAMAIERDIGDDRLWTVLEG